MLSPGQDRESRLEKGRFQVAMVLGKASPGGSGRGPVLELGKKKSLGTSVFSFSTFLAQDSSLGHDLFQL